MNELALFAGAGGGILGGQLLGWKTVCAVEINTFCARRLMQRQNEGHLPPFPIWDDVCTFDGRPWKGIIDVVSGGFPCQDISAAGKGAGIEGKKSGLWVEMARIIGEVLPRYCFVENSPILTIRGLNKVLGDLSEMGYDARWGVIGAHHAGAPHKRDRIWLVADADKNGRNKRRQCITKAGCDGSVRKNWWAIEPELGRVAHGMAHRVDRLKATAGTWPFPMVKIAWETLLTFVYENIPKANTNI